MTNENVLLGTDLKIKVELICDGFDMLANDFVIKDKAVLLKAVSDSPVICFVHK